MNCAFNYFNLKMFFKHIYLSLRFNDNGKLYRFSVLSSSADSPLCACAGSYDVPEISKHLDFLNIMSYDFHGTWDSAVGHNAPLYPLETASREEQKMSVVSSPLQYPAAREWWLS